MVPSHSPPCPPAPHHPIFIHFRHSSSFDITDLFCIFIICVPMKVGPGPPGSCWVTNTQCWAQPPAGAQHIFVNWQNACFSAPLELSDGGCTVWMGSNGGISHPLKSMESWTRIPAPLPQCPGRKYSDMGQPSPWLKEGSSLHMHPPATLSSAHISELRCLTRNPTQGQGTCSGSTRFKFKSSPPPSNPGSLERADSF